MAEIYVYRQNPEGNMGSPLARVPVERSLTSGSISFSTREGEEGFVDFSKNVPGAKGQVLGEVNLPSTGLRNVAMNRETGVGMQRLPRRFRLVVQVIPPEALVQG